MPPKTPAPAVRKKIGILLLFVVIVLWLSSSFLTHAIFSDDSYSKPYFITYLNTCSFCLYLLPWGAREGWRRWRRWRRSLRGGYAALAEEEEEEGEGGGGREGEAGRKRDASGRLGTRQTMKLSLQFCVLWFIANYFQSYCLKWTSVASATILSCTSSIFTLLLGALLRIEQFTWAKLLAVLLSFSGVSLISSVDITPRPHLPAAVATATTTSSPEKRVQQVLLGDCMALLGALAYGVYTVLLKVRIRHERNIAMTRFFGFVGLFNLLGLWPGLVLLHYVGVEKFELPTDSRVWWIVAVNASITLVSDYCWAYAMLLTTPLTVTIGLSLTIPLALLAQMVVLGATSSAAYWAGAAMVFVGFLFVSGDWESR